MIRKIAIFWSLLLLILVISGLSDHVCNVRLSESDITRYRHVHRLSSYDELFREMGSKHNIDWRMLAAIAHVESRFRPHSTSYAGAIGMMQIMPRVARAMGVEPIKLYNAELNVDLSCQILNSIDKILRFDKYILPRDRRALILASYNGGIGHILDARRLAKAMGGDGNSWSDVSRALSVKNDSEHQSTVHVRNGRLSGVRYILRYVDDVLAKYDEYCAAVVL
ncbi:MAG: transglycosylase SLT domain-containing protein [Rikenellaceae bacterium]